MNTMPPLLIYALLILAISSIAGFGFKLGGALSSFLTAVGFVVVLMVLWEPLIKPFIEKIKKK